MKVSVVICAYTMDRWSALNDAVQSCVDQTVGADEIILVIDHNDELYERASDALRHVRVIKNQSSRGLSGARNTGVSCSVGDVVVFLDDDAYAEPNWLAELIAPFDDPTVAGVGGWIVPHWETKAPTWFPLTFYWILGCSYEGLPPTRSAIRNPIGASMALRRRVFSDVGGFSTGIGRIGKIPLGCEETELCIRYSTFRPSDRFILTHEAIVHHRVPASRLTWHYFWSRCWAEGLSKAAVTSLVGASSGFSAERRHLLQSLPSEIFGSVRAIRHDPRSQCTRVALIVAGTFTTAAGVVRGHFAIRRTPILPGSIDIDESLRSHDRPAD